MKTSFIWTETEVQYQKCKNPCNLQTTYNLNTGLVDKIKVWYGE